MVSYAYDSWGKPYSVTGTKAATLGVLNPFRYRGYVYDEALGDEENSITAGTSFHDLGEDWLCPLCSLGKDVFEKE